MKISNKLSSFDYLKKSLAELEKFLSGFTDKLDGILQEAVHNTLIAGGKRIRPALFMICANNNDYDIEYLMPAAAAIEIIHTASLIHDDIIDKSVLRRGRKTIHKKYGEDTAKFVGDYLFAHSFWLLNSYKNKRIILEMSEAAKLLVKGEFDQLKTKKKINQSEEIYFDKINEKTSSLFSLSCMLGGILSRSQEHDIYNMKRFGEYIGISFQINDDLIDLDVESSSVELGKNVGSDLKQGNITLPIIYGLKDRDFRKEARPILEKDSINDEELKRILVLLSKTKAIEKTRNKFDYFIKKARDTAGSINGQHRKEGLYAVCDFISESKKSSGSIS